MNYQLNKLKNGVRVLTVPMPSLESATITIWVKTGSRNEEDKVLGISHFLEHMVFKGSSKYPNAKIVSETIDALGAENNAGTSKEWTNFYIKTASINLEKAFDVLADTVLNPLLNQEEIDRERNVIFQEIAMYDDTPIMSIGENFENLIYSTTRLGRKIAGHKESLDNVNRQEFIDYRKERYTSENLLISVAGGVDEKKVLELAGKYFSEIPTTKSLESNIEKISLLSSSLELKDRVYLKTKKNADQAHVVLGYLCEGRNYSGRFPQAILATILGKGMSSRLFTEVREKRGLAYSVRASLDRYADIGSFDVYAGVAIEKLDETIKVIVNEIEDLRSKKNDITKTEFEKAKSYLKGKLALSLEDSSNVGDFFAEQTMFDKEIMTPKEIYTKVDATKLESVHEEAEKLFSRQIYMSIIGPYKTADKFGKLLI